jgi:hypothetical protein
MDSRHRASLSLARTNSTSRHNGNTIQIEAGEAVGHSIAKRPTHFEPLGYEVIVNWIVKQRPMLHPTPSLATDASQASARYILLL